MAGKQYHPEEVSRVWIFLIWQWMCCWVTPLDSDSNNVPHDLNGRFLPNPLPMTSALWGQTATATDTTPDTAREGAKCGHREGDRGQRQRRGKWMPCLWKIKKISGILLPPWKRTLWQHLPPCVSCPSRDLRHSTSSPKQQGEQARSDDDEERQEHKRDYAPWNEARVTVSWMGVRGFVVVVVGLGKWAMLGLLWEIKSHVWGKWGTLESRFSMDESVNWCSKYVNVQHWNLHRVKIFTRTITSGESIMVLYRFKHNKGGKLSELS